MTYAPSLSIERPLYPIPAPLLADPLPVPRPRPQVAGTKHQLLPHHKRENKPKQIRSVRCGEYTLVTLAGELDLVSFDLLRDTLQNLLAQAAPRLVLDLADVTFADARGISPLVSASTSAALRGGWVRLARVSDRLRMILDITLLTKKLPAYDTVADAVTGAATGTVKPPACQQA